jgi:uncharacterized surface protein with fasciclin (FAS1) repeats
MRNLVETAMEEGNFKILINAIQEAGLIDTLRNEGPFTIFAPTDEAFAKLPSGTMESLLKDKEKLTEFLTCHVVQEKVMTNDVRKITNAKTVNGKNISIDKSEGVKVDNARIVKPDIECSNGVIHVIEKVILPD